LERILGSFEKDGKVVMKSMIRNELFAEMHLLLKKAKKALAQPPLPVQREWVGLTIDEIDVLYGVNCGDGGPTAICEQFVQAVEAKLKEKNFD
jgi:hypothetical protein